MKRNWSWYNFHQRYHLMINYLRNLIWFFNFSFSISFENSRRPKLQIVFRCYFECFISFLDFFIHHPFNLPGNYQHQHVHCCMLDYFSELFFIFFVLHKPKRRTHHTNKQKENASSSNMFYTTHEECVSRSQRHHNCIFIIHTMHYFNA